ncbi:unnamed protein product [Phaedon cochleariae]|uniref:DNA-binding protein D-ETS-4 n=1 Tax=Phaedon cochleariae TaxID=80249 RepID=A0A9P0DRT0_PHACE|nr:unnamed protein product [Phaedon cochleariae]
MVLFTRNNDMDETMPQTVPSAGFTPPCDYSAFADSFDLSLLPENDPFSPSNLFYSSPSPFEPPPEKPKSYPTFYTEKPVFYPEDPEKSDFYPEDPEKSKSYPNFYPLSPHEDLAPDFQTLLVPEDSPDSFSKSYPSIYLDVASPGQPLAALSPGSQGLLSPYGGYRQSGEGNFYPSSPEQYTASPGSVYSRSPCGEEFLQYVKKEGYSSSSSPLHGFSTFGIKEEEGIKEELTEEPDSRCLRQLLETTPIRGQQTPPPPSQNHKLLREALEDTSFQKRFNVRPLDLGLLGEVKMEEMEEKEVDAEEDYLRGCEEGMVQESIAPVLNLAIEQMRKDVDSTCATLGISTDPSQWNSASVLSWIRWTSQQFGLEEPAADQWDMPGPALVALSEEDFTRRASQGGILHAQLEIWKAAYSDDDLRIQWRPETTSSNASSGDISEDEEEETPPPSVPSVPSEPTKPTTSRSATHIHLWQFLKELLATPQANGSCIRWLDRSKGIFKIEDSVKVAKLWGKRKNRPAMNYDKLSRSIRQYYKKGIMKKTERSQRLVYQFCHPYNL